MEKARRDWTRLPVEIVCEIFRLASEDMPWLTVPQYTLVCKAWLIPAQSVLYKDIAIFSFEKLKKFYNTIEHNPYLGDKVRTFSLNGNPKGIKNDSLEIANLSTRLWITFLLGIEELTGHMNYELMLKLLSESQLKELKKINPPSFQKKESEIANYVSCALLIKDRLENILIKDDYQLEEGIEDKRHFQQLYDRLEDFGKIKDIDFTKHTHDEISVFERVLGTCQLLEKVQFSLAPPDNIPNPELQNIDISIESISNFTPNTKIKSLDGYMLGSSDHKLLLYIMHKFPRLQRLSLDMENYTEAQLNQHMLARFLQFLSNIHEVEISFLVADQDTVGETIGESWETTSKLGKENIIINYSEHRLKETQASVNILRLPDNDELGTKIQYCAWNLEQTRVWKHIGMVENMVDL